VEETKIKVKKRDGVVEDWSYDKVIASIGKAMMPYKKAQGIADKIHVWAKESAKEGAIASTAIRDKVIELLSQSDPVSADNYKVFKK